MLELGPQILGLLILDIGLVLLLEKFLEYTKKRRERSLKKYLPAIVAVFIFLIMLVTTFLITMRCNNGQFSSSIGKRGACSHNGGVKTRYPSISYGIIYGTSIAAYFAAKYALKE